MSTKESVTLKQRVFIQEYAKSFNLTKAVRTAYPHMSYGTARSYGVYLKKRHPVVSLHISSLHAKMMEEVDVIALWNQYKAICDDHYNKKIWLRIITSKGTVIDREKDCTGTAMKALDAMVRLYSKLAKNSVTSVQRK